MKKYALGLLLLVGLAQCTTKQPPTLTDQQIITAWGELSTYLAKTTPGNSPTYASRGFGYIGLTMYESVVAGFPSHQSVASQLNGLGTMPSHQPNTTYDWRASLNAGQSTILKSIYQQTSDRNKTIIDSLEKAIYTQLINSGQQPEVLERSVAYGKQVAKQIAKWAETDGGYRAYMKNFDKQMKYPSQKGCWKPPLYAQSFSHYPLHPHWGKNRTFLAVNSQLKPPTLIPFDTTKGSAYYEQFKQVYDKNNNLTQAEKEAALWWGDDPDETFTPPGHSFYLATVVIKKANPSFIQCAETYARVGMAVADAFRNCWGWKYEFFTERPNTYITEHIDPHFESFWPDPPFPAFPSGHAMNASAAAAVLTDLYGNNFAFTDSSHHGRKPDALRNVAFKVRSFKSFEEMAEETANSRFYGGIHTPQDNAEGLKKGTEIGKNINQLAWRKDKSIASN